MLLMSRAIRQSRVGLSQEDRESKYRFKEVKVVSQEVEQGSRAVGEESNSKVRIRISSYIMSSELRYYRWQLSLLVVSLQSQPRKAHRQGSKAGKVGMRGVSDSLKALTTGRQPVHLRMKARVSGLMLGSSGQVCGLKRIQRLCLRVKRKETAQQLMV